MSALSKNEIDMIHGPMAKKIIIFAIPLALSSMLQQLFNAADLAVVGRFASSQSMAAVGSNSAVISLLVSMFVGMSIGANVVLGNILGSGKRESVSDAVHTVFSVALIAGFSLLVLGIALARPVLRIMNVPEDIIDLAVLYLRIYFIGMPPIMLYNFGSAVLRSKGDSRRPFIALVSAGVLNVVLNVIFVAVFHLNVVGVALATVLSNFLSGGLTIRFLMTEKDEFRLYPKRISINKEYLVMILKIGIPAGMQGMVFSFSNVFIQSAINSFGSDCVAGIAAEQNLDFMSYCMVNAFANTCTTFTSQNYGAKNEERCKKVWRLSMGIGLIADISLILIIVLLSKPLLHLFTDDPEVLKYSMIKVRYCLSLHFICCTYEVSAGALRGMNRSALPAIIAIVGTCAARLLYVILIFPMFNTPEALILVYPITWVITSFAMNTAYFSARRKMSLSWPKPEGTV